MLLIYRIEKIMELVNSKYQKISPDPRLILKPLPFIKGTRACCSRDILILQGKRRKGIIINRGSTFLQVHAAGSGLDSTNLQYRKRKWIWIMRPNHCAYIKNGRVK